MKLFLKALKAKALKSCKTIDIVFNINIHKHDIFVIKYKQYNFRFAVIPEF